MTVKRKIDVSDCIYFITFSCYKWISLFDIVSGYDLVYNWFNKLLELEITIVGFVIMPNHVHVMIYIPQSIKNLNTVIGNGKRFIAYELIDRLKEKNMNKFLKALKKGVTSAERERGKIHKVFNVSFDAKSCESRWFAEQKLDYIHHNPVSGKWNLVDDFTFYKHSSASYYERNVESRIPITHYLEYF